MFDVKAEYKTGSKSGIKIIVYEIRCDKVWFERHALAWMRKGMEDYMTDEGDTWLFAEQCADNPVSRALISALQNPQDFNTGMSEPNSYMIKCLSLLLQMWD